MIDRLSILIILQKKHDQKHKFPLAHLFLFSCSNHEKKQKESPFEESNRPRNGPDAPSKRRNERLPGDDFGLSTVGDWSVETVSASPGKRCDRASAANPMES